MIVSNCFHFIYLQTEEIKYNFNINKVGIMGFYKFKWLDDFLYGNYFELC